MTPAHDRGGRRVPSTGGDQEGDASQQSIDPSLALRAGRLDPTLLVVAWFLRRTWIPLLIVGLTVATVVLAEPPDVALDSLAGVVRAILSPWGGVAVAIILRLAVQGLALLLAVPLTAWPRHDDYPASRVGRATLVIASA